MSAGPDVRPRGIDRFLPAYHFSEVHDVLVRAPRARTSEAIRRVTAREIRFFRALMVVRMLPAALAGRAKPRSAFREPLLDVFLRSGFVVLHEEPERELVFGGIGQFWRLTGGSRVELAGPEGFRSFDTPGHARVAMDFRLEDEGEATRVTTETRIFTPEAPARRAFGAYWLVVHPGSALIRRMWLAAIRRRAERVEPG